MSNIDRSYRVNHVLEHPSSGGYIRVDAELEAAAGGPATMVEPASGKRRYQLVYRRAKHPGQGARRMMEAEGEE